jgi:triacylglycerol lipase
VTAPPAPPLVVLLHGLARRQGSMAGLGRVLEAGGFQTWATTYPSRKLSIADAAHAVADELAAAAAGRPLYAVTHSLGGILIRHMGDPRLDWRRIVMLAPPSQGSALAAALADNPLYRWLYGPAGVELRDGSAWPPPPAPFAVIAGTRRLAIGNPTSWTLGLRLGAGRPHDGTVAADEARLPGMSAYAEIDATHTWIMNHPDAHALVLAFLRHGGM